MKMPITMALCLVTGASTADIGDSLVIQSTLKLAVVIAQKLSFETANCKLGKLSACQDALLSKAELGGVDSELALRQLHESARSHKVQELIDEALSKVDDVRSSIQEIQDELDK